MIVLGTVPPVIVLTVGSYDRTRYSNKHSCNEYMIVLSHYISTETNIQPYECTRLVLRDIARIMCWVMIPGRRNN